MADFEMLIKMFSEVRKQSFIRGPIINGWGHGSINVHGSQGFCMRVLWE